MLFYKDLSKDNRMKIKTSKAVKRQDESRSSLVSTL